MDSSDFFTNPEYDWADTNIHHEDDYFAGVGSGGDFSSGTHFGNGPFGYRPRWASDDDWDQFDDLEYHWAFDDDREWGQFDDFAFSRPHFGDSGGYAGASADTHAAPGAGFAAPLYVPSLDAAAGKAAAAGVAIAAVVAQLYFIF